MRNFYLTFVLFLLVGCGREQVVTFAEAADPTPVSSEDAQAWEGVNRALNAGWGSADIAYSRSLVPQNLSQQCAVAAWRGERVSAQLLVWSAKGLKGVECKISDFKSKGATLPAEVAKARFVRYTLADKAARNCLCGRTNGHLSALQADMIDNLPQMDIEEQTTRPIWVTIDIPSDAPAGNYRAEVKVSHRGFGSVTLPIEVEVIGQQLAAPEQWSYHLDLWQHPSAVARMAGVDMWSEEHFEAMRPVMKMLAEAGQKVITATLNRDPWRYQCFDDYEPMIYWTLYDNDRWEYDYTIFDKWVEFMISLGIDKQINCYSMLPWGDCILDFHDKRSTKSERNRTVSAVPDSENFEKMWGPFLVDFAAHLREKGWLEMTNIAIDERAPEDMDRAAALIKKYAPELGFAIADNHNSYKRYTNMRDVCVGQKQAAMSLEEIATRRANGDVSTYYVCCSTFFPNTFTYSQPFEAELLGLYAIAFDYDGMLRWSYNSWPANPQYDSRFRYWGSGDTFLVYPDARTSLRFERLRDGIEFSEKVRTLRTKYPQNAALQPLEDALVHLRGLDINDPQYDWQRLIASMNSSLNDISRELAK
ncbi:MAG: DUF4091 domain-containing protein [Alistipes sp.]|nr:DUF4091 domain-containing protein [Alistipes sp.]